MRILILGNRGMLGNCVEKYFRSAEGLEVVVTDLRWPSDSFIDFVRNNKFDWIVNCVAKIPQGAEKNLQNYFIVNFGLPVFLASLDSKLIQASSDANDGSLYSLSKDMCDRVLANFENAYTIKCSIIGIETKNSKSLLSKFLNSEDKNWSGYSNCMWDGITTLEWVKIAHSIILGKLNYNTISPYSNTISKHDLLIEFNKAFGKDMEIIPSKYPVVDVEKKTDGLFLGRIGDMLIDLKIFYDEK